MDAVTDPYFDIPHTADLATDDRFEDRWTHERAVTEEVGRLRVRRDATRALRAEESAQEVVEPFDAGTLAEILARPAEPAMRVAGLVPSSASMLLVAQRKCGKTTMLLNYARALLTGEPFLGHFDVIPTAGNVAVLNFEVSAAQLARWAHDIGVPAERLLLVNLRGRRNPLTHPDDRTALAERLREHQTEVVIVDPFGRAYGGTSQNDAGEVGSWLVDLDRFARGDVGASDLVLTAHAGWNGDRTRGSSALEDWADVIVTLTRDTEDEESPTYMRAIGRDVDLDEDALTFDPDTRTLSMAGTGSRRQSRQARKLDSIMGQVVEVVTANPGANVAAIREGLTATGENARRSDVSAAAAELVRRGVLHTALGPRNSTLHRLTNDPFPVVPTRTGNGSRPVPTRPMSGNGSGGPGTALRTGTGETT